VSEREELERDDHWQRLDRRMMLVQPVRELVRFLPVLVGLLLARTAADGGGDPRWQLLAVAVPVALGLLRYLTTRFRITAGRIELRRGLLNRHVLATPLDRVRTIDLTATPTHRLLGLTTVRIGTGTASTDEHDALALDGLPLARARRLREALLRVVPADTPTADTPDPDSADPGTVTDAPGAPDAGTPDHVVLRLDPSWVRFAPLTSSGVVLAAGVLGVGSQLLESLGWPAALRPGRLATGAAGLGWWVGVPLAVLALAVVVSVLAVGGYVVANWGFTLTRAPRSWHLTRGLLTTRETSLDHERVGGVSLAQPLGLRLAGGARLHAIVTGLGGQPASSVLVPPAPLGVVEAAAREVLGHAGPVDVPLTGHGPRARTRRWSRALVPALLVAAALVLLVGLDEAPVWLLVPAVLLPPVAATLAADRVRALGHALADDHLVASSGSLDRRREVLACDSVIGWTMRSTLFQRRAGLTSLVATTAGGRQRVTVRDVPETDAVDLAGRATPGLLDPFLSPPAG
jgi:putative membrane protein